MKQTDSLLIPPLKIQGKKTNLVPRIMEIANEIHQRNPRIDTWVEPFCGSGVVAFNVPSYIRRVIVSDVNPHIINFYRSVADGSVTGDSVRSAMHSFSEALKARGVAYYLEMRDKFNKEKGVMEFLFLTRTGFNGVMRFNGKCEWNVPFCKVDDRLSERVIEELAESVERLAELFKSREYVFVSCPFEEAIERYSDERSLTYCDPPYYGLSTQYYKGWGEADERRLAKCLDGHNFVYSTWISNGERVNPMVNECWSKHRVTAVYHRYIVAPRAKDRVQVVEGIVYNGNKPKS